MKKTAAALALAITAAPALALAAGQGTMHGMAPMQEGGMETVMVGGHAMYPNRTIVQNALNSSDHTTLVAAVKAAGLAGALQGHGPFTVFAPTNEAFADLPPGTVQTLLKPQNKAELTKILTYHVVPGDWTTTKLRAAALADGGSVTLKTLEGGTLRVSSNGSQNLVVRDEKGDVADITIADVNQSNGVIQVIDRVLMPGS